MNYQNQSKSNITPRDVFMNLFHVHKKFETRNLNMLTHTYNETSLQGLLEYEARQLPKHGVASERLTLKNTKSDAASFLQP